MDAKISNFDEMKNVLQVKDIPTGITLSILSNCHYYTFKIGLLPHVFGITIAGNIF